jgi:predicted DCC family thiol-disulfide oxidoreductase YuxK
MRQPEGEHPVVIFDGDCGLCQSSVQFMLRHDPREVLYFAPRQSTAGQALLVRCGFVDASPNSVVLVEGNRASTQSTAVLRIARYLRFPWNLAGIFTLIPAPLRDAAYGWVARNRFRFAKKAPVCRLPTESERKRFLDAV